MTSGSQPVPRQERFLRTFSSPTLLDCCGTPIFGHPSRFHLGRLSTQALNTEITGVLSILTKGRSYRSRSTAEVTMFTRRVVRTRWGQAAGRNMSANQNGGCETSGFFANLLAVLNLKRKRLHRSRLISIIMQRRI